MEEIAVDSIQLLNCQIICRSKAVIQSEGEEIITDKEPISIRARYDDQIIIYKDTGKIILQQVQLSPRTRLSISRDGNAIKLVLISENEELQPGEWPSAHSTISVNEGFFVKGRHIVTDIPSLKEPLEETNYVPIEIRTRFTCPTAKLVGKSKRTVLELFFPQSDFEGSKNLLQNLRAGEITFAELKKVRRKNRLVSTIKKGVIEIAAIDLTGKRFLVKEEFVDFAEFLQIPKSDVYDIDFIRLDEDGLKMSLYNDKARGLSKGKRSHLTRSIFPSVLEWAVEEPSHKTLWVVVVFLFTNISLWIKFGRKYLCSDKNAPKAKHPI